MRPGQECPLAGAADLGLDLVAAEHSADHRREGATDYSAGSGSTSAGVPAGDGTGVGREPRNSGRSAAFSSTGITSAPVSRPRMPPAWSSSPKRSTRSARTPGPGEEERHRVAGVDHLRVGRRGVVAGDADDVVGEALRQVAQGRVHGLDGAPLEPRDPWCGRPRRSPSGGRGRSVAPASNASPGASSRARSAGAGSSPSGLRTNRSPSVAARPARNGDAPDERAVQPVARAERRAPAGGRPHHFSVTTPSAGRAAPARARLTGWRAKRSRAQPAPELDRARRRGGLRRPAAAGASPDGGRGRRGPSR